MHHFDVQLSSGGIEQLHLLDRQIQQLLLHQLPQGRIIQGQLLFRGLFAPFGPTEQNHLTAAAIDHPPELLTAADRPVDSPGGQLEFRFNFIQKRQGLPAGTIHLVDEGEDRDLAHPTHLKQLPRLRLQALGGVLEHHGVIGRRQGAIGVLGEVLVTRRVEQVDRGGVVVELQHRRSDRDAPLFFQLHPVGGHLALLAAGLHRTGLLNRTAVQQQLFRQGCLASIRMGNDREVAATIHRLCHQSGQVRFSRRRAAHRSLSIHQA